MPPRADFKWKPIERWIGPWPTSPLHEVYQAFANQFDPAALEAHTKRVAREWSVETGQIEGAYDIDPAAAALLVEEGFNASQIPEQSNGLSQERVHAILCDTEAVLEFDRPLTPHYVRALHQQLMNNIDTRDVHVNNPVTGHIRVEQCPLRKGEYKKEPNNPTRQDSGAHEYCPPFAVDAEMDRLFTLYKEMESECAPPELLAAWLHLAFVQIHPFEDGNGRVARALATAVLMKAGLPPLTVIRDMRPRYIGALESADDGDRQPLLEFFESCLYRQIFLLWSEIDPDPPQAPLVRPTTGFPSTWHEASTHLNRLRSSTIGWLAGIRANFAAASPVQEPLITVMPLSLAAANVAVTQYWGESAIRRVAEPPSPESLVLSASAMVSILFHRFHDTRPGLAAVTATLTLDGAVKNIGHPFFITFKAPGEAAFQQWLDRNLTEAIRLWQQAL